MTDPTNIANRMGFNMEDMNKRRDYEEFWISVSSISGNINNPDFVCNVYKKYNLNCSHLIEYAAVVDMQAQVDHHKQCCDSYSQRNLRLVKEIELLNRELEALGVSVNTYDKINDRLKAQLELAKTAIATYINYDDESELYEFTKQINQLDKGESMHSLKD